MLQLGKFDGLYQNPGEVTLNEVVSLECGAAAKAKLLAGLFGTLNAPGLCAQLKATLSQCLQPYQEHLQNVQGLFVECVSQLDPISRGELPKPTRLLAQEAGRNEIGLDGQIWVSLKYYLLLHPAPLARFKGLRLGKIKLSPTYESQCGMTPFYQDLLRKKLENVGFLYSLTQEHVPYPVSKSRIKILQCEIETWLPGAAVGNRNWITLVQEWAKSGSKQGSAANAFFQILCFSKLIISGLPKGPRPEKLTIDRGGLILQPEETLQHFVQRSTIREVYEKILRFPPVPGNIKAPFVFKHAPLCQDIVHQELMRECIDHISKPFEKDKRQAYLEANRQRIEATFEEALSSPQHAFLLSALLVAFLRQFSPYDVLNTEELFEQIYAMDASAREELYRSSAATYYPSKTQFPSEGCQALMERYGFSPQQRPFILLQYILSKEYLRLIPESSCSYLEQGLIEFSEMVKFLWTLECRCRTRLPARLAFLLLNGHFVSRQFMLLLEEIWGYSNFIMNYHHALHYIPKGFLKNVRNSHSNLEAERARLTSTLKLGSQQQECLNTLIDSAKWVTMHPQSHEAFCRLLYLLPLPAESFADERLKALEHNGRLVELLPGFRSLWTHGHAHQEGFEVQMRFVYSKSNMQTVALEEVLRIPIKVLEKEVELVDLIIRLSPFICNDWLYSEDTVLEAKTLIEAFQCLSGCKDLKESFFHYMNRDGACRERGLEAIRFLFDIKKKLRHALCHTMEFKREDLCIMASRGNVHVFQGGLSLVLESRPSPVFSLCFKELEPCLRQIMEGKDAKLVLKGTTKEMLVDMCIFNKDDAHIEISLSFNEEKALSVNAQMNLDDDDADKLRYLTWLTLMLKAKWFGKMIPKKV